MGKADARRQQREKEVDPERRIYLNKNKEAAARCRKKRIDTIVALQERVKQLEELDGQNKRTIDHLVEQNKKLVDIVERYIGSWNAEGGLHRVPAEQPPPPSGPAAEQPLPSAFSAYHPPLASYLPATQQLQHYQPPLGIAPQPAPLFAHPSAGRGAFAQTPQVLRRHQQSVYTTSTILSNSGSDEQAWAQQVRRQMNSARRVRKPSKGKMTSPGGVASEKRTSSTAGERPDSLHMDDERAEGRQVINATTNILTYMVTPGLTTPSLFGDVNLYRQQTFLTPLNTGEIPLIPMDLSPLYGLIDLH